MSTQIQKKGHSLPVKQSTYAIEALASPQVTLASPQDIFKALNVAIMKAYLDTGTTPPAGEVSIPGTSDMINIYQGMVNDLVLWVRLKRGSLRLNEIGIAIANGVEGEAGKYFGLNKNTFQQFLTYHCYNEDRKKRLAAHLLGDGEAKVIPSYEQQFNVIKGNVISAYDLHCKDLDISRSASPNYDFLYLVGLLNYSDDDERRALEYSKQRVITNAKTARMSCGDMFARMAITNLIDQAQAATITAGSEVHLKISSMFKSIMIKKYYDDVKLSNTDLAELIESKRPVYYKHLADVDEAKAGQDAKD